MSELSLYESQLQQIQTAIQTSSGAEREKLISLERDIKELINLSFIQSLEEAEVPKILEDMTSHNHLLNQKCRAPFFVSGLESYHNAFIAEIIEEENSCEVFVKVFFLNPTIDRMKSCDFYFSDKCSFGEEDCKFSHGTKISFAKLKPYQDPIYTLLKNKCHVLAKTENGLWKPATVIEANHHDKSCQIKFHSGKTVHCCFSEILPPLETSSDSSSDLSSEDSDDEEREITVTNFLQIDNKSFAEWEKFTRGIGSKIMQKLGYVAGEGLGKNSEGRKEPVSAKIYVAKKSLDFNMELNEKKYQQTVEEKIKKDSLRHQKISEKNYARKDDDVFSIINAIGTVKPSTSAVTKTEKDVKSQSVKDLRISNFKIEEDIKKSEKSLEKIKESLRRHKSDSATAKSIQKQVDAKQNEILCLQRKLSAVSNEQKSRSEKSKLTIF